MSDTSIKCPRCGKKLKRSKVSSEPEGIRQDAVCEPCQRIYMSTKSQLVDITPTVSTDTTLLDWMESKPRSQSLRATLKMSLPAAFQGETVRRIIGDEIESRIGGRTLRRRGASE